MLKLKINCSNSYFENSIILNMICFHNIAFNCEFVMDKTIYDKFGAYKQIKINAVYKNYLLKGTKDYFERFPSYYDDIDEFDDIDEKNNKFKLLVIYKSLPIYIPKNIYKYIFIDDYDFYLKNYLNQTIDFKISFEELDDY
jgi:hypothetical protein